MSSRAPAGAPHKRPRPAAARARIEHRLDVATKVAVALVATVAVALALATLLDRGSASSDDPAAAPPGTSGEDVANLPNPMGGPVIAAPAGSGTSVNFGGLDVHAPDVAMGDVPLDVTVVPRWTVSNPTSSELTFTVGQPQVVEGCCPGPVHVDGRQADPGSTVTVGPGAQAVVQFPLQMHPGMDGPHHLVVPLESGGEPAALHVTGNFTNA